MYVQLYSIVKGGDTTAPVMVVARVFLLIPQSFNGIQQRGFSGRVKAEEDAYEGGKEEG